MKRRDARALDHKTLQEIRIRAVERVQAGESPEAVIQSDYPPGFDVDELGIDQEDDLWP